MLELLMQWYRRRFSDPEAIALLVILLAGFVILFFFSGLLAPLLVAIVLAYLLEWPTVRLERVGFSRRWAPRWCCSVCRHSDDYGICGDAGCLAAGDESDSRHAGYAQ
jgi:hypothetical protein